jgi:hypothetical protein
MNWFYARAGQAHGPLSEADLDALVRAGTLEPTTLVAQKGMAGWIPYAEARGAMRSLSVPPVAPAEIAPPVLAQSACVECGVVSPVETMVALGGGWMCAQCKPRYLQRLLQGTAAPVERTPFAGFWIRAAAKLLDAMFLGVVFGALTFLAGLVLAFFVGAYKFTPDVAPENFILAVVLIYGVMLLYAALSKSATPGKRICGLRIVNRHGEPSLGAIHGGITLLLHILGGVYHADKRGGPKT